MSFGQSIKSVFSQYATFSGRARRSEYWYFCLFDIIVSTAIACIIPALLGQNVANVVDTVWGLAILLPSLAVTVRRLHDAGKSGWYIFISLIPIVGVILLIIKLAKDSEPGENKYGPNPKG